MHTYMYVCIYICVYNLGFQIFLVIAFWSDWLTHLGRGNLKCYTRAPVNDVLTGLVP